MGDSIGPTNFVRTDSDTILGVDLSLTQSYKTDLYMKFVPTYKLLKSLFFNRCEISNKDHTKD